VAKVRLYVPASRRVFHRDRQCGYLNRRRVKEPFSIYVEDPGRGIGALVAHKIHGALYPCQRCAA